MCGTFVHSHGKKVQAFWFHRYVAQALNEPLPVDVFR